MSSSCSARRWISLGGSAGESPVTGTVGGLEPLAIGASISAHWTLIFTGAVALTL